MYFLGIDPGANGGYGLVDKDGAFVDCGPATPEALRRINVLFNIQTVGLEKIISQRRDAGRRYAAAALRESFGYWRGFWEALGIPLKTWTPQQWQGYFNILIRGGSFGESQRRTAKRHLILGRARALFPGAELNLVRDEGQAAGLLLAYFTAARCNGEKWIRSKKSRSRTGYR